MPNYCMNKLYLDGDEKQIQKFMKGIDYKLGFIRTYFPLPDELVNTVACFDNDGGVKLKVNGEHVVLSDEDAKAFVERNGANDWYNWANENWGTKWGDFDTECEGVGILSFYSAWSPPIPALDHISKMFPKVEFTLEYFEDGMGFEGTAVFLDGYVSDDCRDIPEEYYDQFMEE